MLLSTLAEEAICSRIPVDGLCAENATESRIPSPLSCPSLLPSYLFFLLSLFLYLFFS